MIKYLKDIEATIWSTKSEMLSRILKNIQEYSRNKNIQEYWGITRRRLKHAPIWLVKRLKYAPVWRPNIANLKETGSTRVYCEVGFAPD